MATAAASGRAGMPAAANGRGAGAGDEANRLVSMEISRALSIACMRGDDLVAYVRGRLRNGGVEDVPRGRIRGILGGLIAGGTVEEFDAFRAEAAGVGCPCCTGGQDMSSAGAAAAAEPVMRMAGAGKTSHTVSHAAYRLLDAWGDEHGMLAAPSRDEFLADLCRRGRYGLDEADESARLLVKWRVFAVRNGVLAVNAAADGRRPA